MMNDGCQSGIASKTVDPLSAFRQDASHSAGSNNGRARAGADGMDVRLCSDWLAWLAGWVPLFPMWREVRRRRRRRRRRAHCLECVSLKLLCLTWEKGQLRSHAPSGGVCFLCLPALPCSGCRATREAAICSLDARPPPAALPTFPDSTRLPH